LLKGLIGQDILDISSLAKISNSLKIGTKIGRDVEKGEKFKEENQASCL